MSENHDCDCGTALENLYTFIDRELDSASAEQIQQHLDECVECIGEYDMERMVKLVVSRSCTEIAPGELRQRVLMTIRSVQVRKL